MKKPACKCIQETLNQFVQVDFLSTTTEVYYASKNTCKGYEETSVFLKSLYCPQCGEKYQVEDD